MASALAPQLGCGSSSDDDVPEQKGAGLLRFGSSPLNYSLSSQQSRCENSEARPPPSQWAARVKRAVHRLLPLRTPSERASSISSISSIGLPAIAPKAGVSVEAASLKTGGSYDGSSSSSSGSAPASACKSGPATTGLQDSYARSSASSRLNYEKALLPSPLGRRMERACSATLGDTQPFSASTAGHSSLSDPSPGNRDSSSSTHSSRLHVPGAVLATMPPELPTAHNPPRDVPCAWLSEPLPPAIQALSPTGGGSRALQRAALMLDRTGAAAASTSTPAPETPAATPAAAPPPTHAARRDASAAESNQEPAMRTVPTTPASPRTMVLAVSPGLPPAMRRPVWELGDYVLHKRIAKAATSAVYKATCNASGYTVALKVYFLERLPVNTVHMLKREIEVHTQLTHRHVLRLYGAFMDEKRCVLVLEYAARGDLYGILQRLGRMPADQAAGVVTRPLLDALSYLHARGVCHRDIKPENILFTRDWRLVLADFGVSIDISKERAVTRAGTEGYMAPEVQRCPLKADPLDNKDVPGLAYSTSADVWAAGVLVYELLCGFPPAATIAAAVGPGAMRAASADPAAAAPKLRFPAFFAQPARSFIEAAMDPAAEDRPTAPQLLRHPWILQQQQQQQPN